MDIVPYNDYRVPLTVAGAGGAFGVGNWIANRASDAFTGFVEQAARGIKRKAQDEIERLANRARKYFRNNTRKRRYRSGRRGYIFKRRWKRRRRYY